MLLKPAEVKNVQYLQYSGKTAVSNLTVTKFGNLIRGSINTELKSGLHLLNAVGFETGGWKLEFVTVAKHCPGAIGFFLQATADESRVK